ncbi:NALCN channel auxiliary factor 2 isoform X2 [Scleropages formosus]|uniref:NALCN channel auxiliary factor 2 isoform X2 n=1 Tax=Scleropages formosus TaxID=113540 RepID=UPI0010FA7E63|nr:transmembrane protein FAM155B isoform X2 [Scleropages formosus]
MIRGAWMYRREDDAALEICCAPEQSDKPCADSERAQKWRMSLASLLFFTVLLSDHLWLCAGVKLLSKDRSGRRSWGSAAADEEEGGGHAVRNNGLHSHAAAPATRDPACADAGSSSRLESACAALHWRGAGSWVALAAHNRSALSPHALLAHFRAFSLSFCDSYTMSDLLVGMAEPDGLNCSLQNMVWDLASGRVALDDDEDVCGSCIQAYMRLDQHAQEKYEEFELLFLKYLPEDYSVRSRLEDCKVVYKAWLCSEFFNVTQSQCHHRIPCKQYCLEVQTRCPFVLPDNDDLVYGGLSSFICTGLLENHLTNAEPECCDVRWRGCDPAGEGPYGTSAPPPGSATGPRRSSQAASAAARLYSSRFKLCVLVLILLHTVVTFSAVADHSGVSLEALRPMEESSAREE